MTPKKDQYHLEVGEVCQPIRADFDAHPGATSEVVVPGTRPFNGNSAMLFKTCVVQLTIEPADLQHQDDIQFQEKKGILCPKQYLLLAEQFYQCQMQVSDACGGFQQRSTRLEWK